MMAHGQALRIAGRFFVVMFELVDLISWNPRARQHQKHVSIPIWLLGRRLSRVAMVCDVLL